jgi:hypothetical protein
MKLKRFSTAISKSEFLPSQPLCGTKEIPKIQPTLRLRATYAPSYELRLAAGGDHDQPRRAGHSRHRYQLRLVSHGVEMGATPVGSFVASRERVAWQQHRAGEASGHFVNCLCRSPRYCSSCLEYGCSAKPLSASGADLTLGFDKARSAIYGAL